MIRIRLTTADLGRTRFAYSPLAEIGESLYLLATGSAAVPHAGWLEEVRPRLRRVDRALLTAVVPARPFLAGFFLRGAADRSTGVEQQLRALAATPVDLLRRDLAEVWQDTPPPRPLADLLADARHGPGRLADALWDYWCVALEPYWPAIRGLLDDDIAHRASGLTRHGLTGLFRAMHPDLTVRDDRLQIRKRQHQAEHELAGTGILLVPSVFAWPNLLFETDGAGPPSLTYPARGLGTLWGSAGAGADTGPQDALGALVGRSRAAVLRELAVPRSTTDLARSLGMSPPAVSQHLAVLRRSALVESRRSGRAVLYQWTELGSEVVEAALAG